MVINSRSDRDFHLYTDGVSLVVSSWLHMILARF